MPSRRGSPSSTAVGRRHHPRRPRVRGGAAVVGPRHEARRPRFAVGRTRTHRRRDCRRGQRLGLMLASSPASLHSPFRSSRFGGSMPVRDGLKSPSRTRTPSSNKTRLRLPLTFYNTGAKALVVANLQLRVEEDPTRTELKWITTRDRLRPEGKKTSNTPRRSGWRADPHKKCSPSSVRRGVVSATGQLPASSA